MENRKRPKVTVIMPSLNVAAYIRESMESVVSQTLADIEILCVDAQSTDGTEAVLRAYESGDSRVKVLISDRRSYGYQINLGIAHARGEYIAILETDDYVDKHMYENLYRDAKQGSLDFLLADYDEFYDEEDGERKFLRRATWADRPEIYGKVLSPENLQAFYNGNSNLWRGIYAREFLVDGGISLNETPGAAYQDIGFMHRVVMRAKRAMFVSASYYRYRTDREGSSVNSVKGLRYSYGEYKYLLDHNEVAAGFEPRVYYMMARSFLGEITHIFPRMDKQWKEDNRIPYCWFRDQIRYGIGQGYLLEETLGSDMWNRLQILLTSLETYLFCLQYPGNSYSLLQKLRGKHAVIFGAGIRGRELYDRLKDQVCIDAFCDNNRALWHREVKGILVLPPEACMETYPCTNYIIAVKNQGDEIREQIRSCGKGGDKIWLYMADEDALIRRHIRSMGELLSFFEQEKHAVIYLYGAGAYCEQTIATLERAGISAFEKIGGILVSTADGGQKEIHGIKVTPLQKAEIEKDAMILLTLPHRYHREVCEALRRFPVTVCEMNFQVLYEKRYQDVWRTMRPFAENFRHIPVGQDETETERKQYVFTLWWQGEEEAPGIVKTCIRSQRHFLPDGAEHVVITQANYREWISLPDFILDKADRGDISVAALSDIIRASLLYEYGGAWFDATLLLAKPVDLHLFDCPIYTRNVPETQFGANAMWSGWYMFVQKGYPLYQFVRDAFFWYYRHYDKITYYHMIDYLTAIACNLFWRIERDLNAVPFNNEEAEKLQRRLTEKYDAEKWEAYLSAAAVHKLTYRMDTNGRGDTIFDYLSMGVFMEEEGK